MDPLSGACCLENGAFLTTQLLHTPSLINYFSQGSVNFIFCLSDWIFLIQYLIYLWKTRPYLDVIMKPRTDIWNQYQCLGRRFKNTQSFQKLYIYVYLTLGISQIKFLPFYGCWDPTCSALTPSLVSTHQMLEDGKFWVNYTCLVDWATRGIEFRILDASYRAPGDLWPGV